MDAITFTRDKETQNKIRFTSTEGAVTGSLYVDKAEAGEKQTITVALSE